MMVKPFMTRGAHAMAGMASLIRSRRDAEVNTVAMAKVKEDKDREVGDGFDGTWVAHPDLVDIATESFDRLLGDRPNQLERQRPDVHGTPQQPIDVHAPDGTTTEGGLTPDTSTGAHDTRP